MISPEKCSQRGWMHLADSALVRGLKGKLTKRLHQGPMLSLIEMPPTLTRNNWKQKHSQCLGLRSISETAVPEEAETTDRVYHTQSHSGAVLVLGLPAEYWRGHAQGLALNRFESGQCDWRWRSSKCDRLQGSTRFAADIGLTQGGPPPPPWNDLVVVWSGYSVWVLAGSLSWDVRGQNPLESDLSVNIPFTVGKFVLLLLGLPKTGSDESSNHTNFILN